MELKAFLKEVKANLNIILILSLVFSLAFLLLSTQIPIQYKATSTFFIKREIDPLNPNYFTYEGFYSIQTAEKYTDTVLGFLRTIDIKKKALEKLNIGVNTKELNRIDRAVTVKKVSPQLVALTVTSSDKTYAQNALSKLVESTIETSANLNVNGDPKLSIDVIDVEPVVTEIRYNAFWFSVGGFLFGLFLSLSGLSFRKYLKD